MFIVGSWCLRSLSCHYSDVVGLDEFLCLLGAPIPNRPRGSLRDQIKGDLLARDVQRIYNAMHRINHYLLDSVIYLVNTYPLDSDFPGG